MRFPSDSISKQNKQRMQCCVEENMIKWDCGCSWGCPMCWIAKRCKTCGASYSSNYKFK